MRDDALIDKSPDSFLRLIRRMQRGRLKIYLGYGAGVGKTYQMLLEGQRLKDEGIDVVIGLVETHGRMETAALAEGLETVSRRIDEYRGVILEEMDVGAILKRKPQVVLIDELAHTNAPGSRNLKRYRDVEDILDEGIHVITTLNIQHLESLYDTVEKTIRIKVRERLPDTIIAEADEIVNVDLTPEDLRKRLQEGKIYPPERIGTALSNFFTEQNLETLRELTLRELAAQIDLRRRGNSEESEEATPDQVMVCISSRGPNSEKLIRFASRLAGRLNRNWYAVYVQTPHEAPAVIDARTQRELSGTLTLAKQLGAMVFTYKGEDIADTIVRFAREYRVGHIVVGSPGPIPFWKRLFKKDNVVQQLIQKTRGATIAVMDTRTYSGTAPVKKPVEASRSLSRGATAPAADGPFSQPTLGSLLSRERIIIWNQPVSKAVAVRDLVNTVQNSFPGDSSRITAAVLQHDEESSTFFNEGVAFPHVRLETITAPIVALGVTKQGMTDTSTDSPIRLVFLLLSPEALPASQTRLLSLASQISKNRSLIETLTASVDAEEVLRSIRRWELVNLH